MFKNNVGKTIDKNKKGTNDKIYEVLYNIYVLDIIIEKIQVEKLDVKSIDGIINFKMVNKMINKRVNIYLNNKIRIIEKKKGFLIVSDDLGYSRLSCLIKSVKNQSVSYEYIKNIYEISAYKELPKIEIEGFLPKKQNIDIKIDKHQYNQISKVFKDNIKLKYEVGIFQINNIIYRTITTSNPKLSFFTEHYEKKKQDKEEEIKEGILNSDRLLVSEWKPVYLDNENYEPIIKYFNKYGLNINKLDIKISRVITRSINSITIGIFKTQPNGFHKNICFISCISKRIVWKDFYKFIPSIFGKIKEDWNITNKPQNIKENEKTKELLEYIYYIVFRIFIEV